MELVLLMTLVRVILVIMVHSVIILVSSYNVIQTLYCICNTCAICNTYKLSGVTQYLPYLPFVLQCTQPVMLIIPVRMEHLVHNTPSTIFVNAVRFSTAHFVTIVSKRILKGN